MNPDLAVERQNPSFNVNAFSAFLYGGQRVLDRRRYIAELVETTPEFNDPKHRSFMSREERYENATRKTVAMLQHAQKLNTSDYNEIQYYQSLVLGGETSPIHLHYIMFLPALQGQASDEQQEKWLPLALSHSIVGTYAQTEMGHGTNLRKLETTATYDSATQEFVINSPTLTSTKWWPGNLGKSSNYAVVIAQLHTKGVNRGSHPFLVQLRDLDTHKPMPGITVGDIGPKFGISSNDNGFLRFDHVRIPRENMLMRFSQVEPDGTYKAPAHSKLAYGAMIFVRSVMIADQALALGMGVTIAVRYGCVRRQGEKVEGQGEVKLLDYQTQQYRLFPELAKTYAYFFAGLHIREIYKNISNQVKQGELELLPELHFMTSGLKAYVSYEVAKGLEICRLSCGGHGYSQASGFPELYGNVVGGCTYEGDNIVMLLQVARYLVKAVRQKSQNSISAYLWKTPTAKSQLNQELNLEHLLDIYEHGARRVILETVHLLGELEKQGYSSEEAWDKCAVRLTKCAKSHVRVFLVSNFINYIKKADAEQSVKKVMGIMCQLYALYGLHTKAGPFVEDGYVSQQQLRYVRHRLYEILAEIRPIAVLLVDAFDFKDRELNSILGRYDGDVYANLFKWARESPLNKQEVLDSYYKYIAPMIRKSKL